MRNLKTSGRRAKLTLFYFFIFFLPLPVSRTGGWKKNTIVTISQATFLYFLHRATERLLGREAGGVRGGRRSWREDKEGGGREERRRKSQGRRGEERRTEGGEGGSCHVGRRRD